MGFLRNETTNWFGFLEVLSPRQSKLYVDLLSLLIMPQVVNQWELSGKERA